MSEREIQRAILQALGSRSDLRLWRSNTGMAHDQAGHVVRFGTPGQGDLSGLLAPSGRRLEIEVKAPSGKQTQQQKQFQAMIEAMGGLYVLARSVEEAVTAIDNAQVV